MGKRKPTPMQFNVEFHPTLMDAVRPWAKTRDEPGAPTHVTIRGCEVRVIQDRHGNLVFKLSKGPWSEDDVYSRRN